MPFSLLLIAPAVILLFFLVAMLPLRLRMECRARALQTRHPGAERTSVYLAFQSGWCGGKGKEMDAKITEMAASGWTFLRATEANPLRTIRSWGGGLTLHFIRIQPGEAQT